MIILEKDAIKQEIVRCLAGAAEVQRIVVFGSFLESDEPRDLDIAVFQTSQESYLDLALRYRQMLRPVSRRLPVDVVPVRPHPGRTALLDQIESGEVIYER